ncbi:uncharacterized protein A1O9_06581 [Exophiala aquamarina CBS 119918]|uniref:N-acetyltransferase domain-containing protein n=1 Tax=Exophiala aquamarina CBS 119918 TaxID=1182545 RepID=A0A072PT12_9EURO|nr:uncharacterized protein A1O9_06581 [Exophiala aquamarina CBS 119918]KEF58655.1 hypothetical protein A1O9_06581 [Exophiala aquamarina CBS 119918]
MADALPYGFCLPIDISKLENSRMSLIPLQLSWDIMTSRADWDRLCSIYVRETLPYPELFDHVSFGPFRHNNEFRRHFDVRCLQDHGTIILAIILKRCTIRKRRGGGDISGGANNVDDLEVEDGTFAGTIGLLNTDVSRSRTEVGHKPKPRRGSEGPSIDEPLIYASDTPSPKIVIFPRFQRTFVGTHAHGLLLQQCLDPLPSGLGLRRVQWQANSQNTTSIRAAQRMGYQLEGIMRWERALAEGKTGIGPSDAQGKGLPMLDANGKTLGIGRHSAMLAICWDDWTGGGGRKRVLELMSR